jgi:quercetin dioxygenase-like cupin family protein
LPAREVFAFFEARGVSAAQWSNAPSSVYEVHDHPYRKMLFCIHGAITFSLPDIGKNVSLSSGDRLILPAGTRHGAIVGPDGVTCIEGAGP